MYGINRNAGSEENYWSLCVSNRGSKRAARLTADVVTPPNRATSAPVCPHLDTPLHHVMERTRGIQSRLSGHHPSLSQDPYMPSSLRTYVRRGVAEIRPELADLPENLVTVNSLVWKEIAAGARNPAWPSSREMCRSRGPPSNW
jgi:hypothetical protein